MTVGSSSQPRKFTFDTVFDGGRVVTPAEPVATFSAEDLEAARAEGFAEGRRSAQALADLEAAAALAEASRAIRAGLTALGDVARAHKADSARLALAVGRSIAGAALDAFPEGPLVAAMQALAREVEAQPRLTVRTAPGQAERLGEPLHQAAEAAGFTGQVVVKADPALAPAAFTFDWGEGRATFDPQAAAARVAAVLDEALAAEDVHAEPLTLALEADA